jgi:hypothetical protein
MSKKRASRFAAMIAEAPEKVCATCAYSYIRPEIGTGFCKHQKNAFGTNPRFVEEMDSCSFWEKRGRTWSK